MMDPWDEDVYLPTNSPKNKITQYIDRYTIHGSYGIYIYIYMYTRIRRKSKLTKLYLLVGSGAPVHGTS